MIRFDQRVADDPRTERIFKKLVHPGQDAVKLVDRDGIPLRLPNSATFSRLQSSYVLSPRGVPTRRSNHSYSGQLSQGKMHPLISSLEPQDTFGFNPLQAYNLSSAGSSRNYMSTANTPSAKKQGLPSRPARKITTASMATANMTTASMATASMAKSASTARTGKYLSSDESIGSEVDLDQFNPSIQGQRLEKEWSALSNCRALKRSSERPSVKKKPIVSHRVDRMYFMTGNSMKIQQKFLVEETDLNQLKELSVARAASRQSRERDQERLRQIEQKLSHIEHRLYHIEEQNEHRVDVEVEPVYINQEGLEDYPSHLSDSAESGIDEGLSVVVNSLEDLTLENEQGEEEEAEEAESSVISLCSIQIRKHKSNEFIAIKPFDIMAYDKQSTQAKTMFKMFHIYPNGKDKPQLDHQYSYDSPAVNLMTLGVPRKIRHAKKHTKSSTPKEKSDLSHLLVVCSKLGKCLKCKSTVGSCPLSSLIRPNKVSGKKKMPTYTQPKHTYVSIDKNLGKVVRYIHPPVGCRCRKSRSGPRLAVEGIQVPIY